MLEAARTLTHVLTFTVLLTEQLGLQGSRRQKEDGLCFLFLQLHFLFWRFQIKCDTLI